MVAVQLARNEFGEITLTQTLRMIPSSSAGLSGLLCDVGDTLGQLMSNLVDGLHGLGQPSPPAPQVESPTSDSTKAMAPQSARGSPNAQLPPDERCGCSERVGVQETHRGADLTAGSITWSGPSGGRCHKWAITCARSCSTRSRVAQCVLALATYEPPAPRIRSTEFCSTADRPRRVATYAKFTTPPP